MLLDESSSTSPACVASAHGFGERDPLVKRIVRSCGGPSIGLAAIISAFGPEYVC